jgi:nucleoid-associated protein EbfC
MASKGRGRGRMPKNPMMKQLQQLQEQLEQAQDSLGDEIVTASVGGGMVTVVMNGHQEVKSVKIDPDVVDPEDVEMLEDLIMAAISEASSKAKAMADSKMGGLTSGLGIPGLM